MRIAEMLVERGLAAAVNIVEQDSVYRWRGRIERCAEFLLMIKSAKESYGAIEKVILSMHSYDLPGVAAVPIIEGFGPYLAWMRNGGRV